METGGNFIYQGFGGFEDWLVNVSGGGRIGEWGGRTGWAIEIIFFIQISVNFLQLGLKEFGEAMGQDH